MKYNLTQYLIVYVQHGEIAAVYEGPFVDYDVADASLQKYQATTTGYYAVVSYTIEVNLERLA